MEFQRVDVVYSLLFDGATSKILMVLNKNGNWTLPGGGVEAGETLREAAKREVMEETGHNIEVGNIVALNEGFMDEKHVFFFTYVGQIIKRPKEIPQEENIIKVEWVDLEDADRLMPYYPEGVSKLINESGARYILQQK
ncbi:NUDIX hydrolase [Peribacillus muralis]|uniref:NUDIX hydrolase n=1 Tax=Peribacillus muralis TaxID=264697 RepID=UPI00380CCD0A